MVARIVLIVLFPVAWPIYFVLWCKRNPEEVRHAVGSARDLIRRHPKRAAWLGVVFGVIGLIGHLADGEFLAMGVGAVVASWCALLLVKWKRQETGAAKAEVVAPGLDDVVAPGLDDSGERFDVTTAEPIGSAGGKRVGVVGRERRRGVSARAGDEGEAYAEVGAQRPGGVASGNDSLFVYGTLQFPRVLRELIGRSPESAPITVAGWRVAALPGRIYPGLVPDTDGLAHGLLLRGLHADERAILDAFEDAEYELRVLDTEHGPVPTYVWTADVAAQDWHPADFAATHLDSFVTECEQWRAAS
ncbi:gamma-glutamylcyclotransferase family protein [Nocardia bovistercoris]|uniref:Putative gamma-glutamylcyclotransferase n=1 Tax=Nocardia bovistercoris TaxID=2785916 RepID=A0A931I853_9NOCA|nr:gamma-glutamylcyclotransferase family protein [Nocardia bovistercoris]MBH0775143.1 gamma-glutamylcyclotransferase [Nocardia bovistercoris]